MVDHLNAYLRSQAYEDTHAIRPARDTVTPYLTMGRDAWNRKQDTVQAAPEQPQPHQGRMRRIVHYVVNSVEMSGLYLLPGGAEWLKQNGPLR